MISTAQALHWLPPLAAPLSLALVALAALATLWSAWRSRAAGRVSTLAALTALRLAVIAALGAILLGPSLLPPVPEAMQRPPVTLLIDRSLSMCTPDAEFAGETMSRADALRATWLAPDALARLGAAADLRIAGFAERLSAEPLASVLTNDPSGRRTRLAHSLRSALASSPSGSHIVILSDGADTDDPTGAALDSLAASALGAGVRLHAVAPGRAERPADVRIHASFDAATAFDGQPVTLRAHVHQSGFDGWPATLAVHRIAAAESSGAAHEVIHTLPITLGAPAAIPITVTPTLDPGVAAPLGLAEYLVRIDPLPGEAELDNNTAPAFIHVSGERIRIAIFENEPYWDSKYFIAAMRADPQIDLTSITGLGRREQVIRFLPGGVGGGEAGDAPPEAPLDEAALFDFDIVVVGRGVERWFGAERADLLRRFVVERGGSLVFLRGAPTMAATPDAAALRDVLADIAPVEWSAGAIAGGALEPTPDAARDGILPSGVADPLGAVLQGLPDMLSTTRVDGERTLSTVWLRHTPASEDGDAPGAAAVAHMPAGRGRTLAVLTDGLWRWAFLPSEMREQATIYRVFWARTVRWLALGAEFLPGQSMSLSADRPMLRPGETITLIVRTRYHDSDAAPPDLIVRDPRGGESRLSLVRADETASAFRASLTPLEPGVYEARFAPDESAPPEALAQRARFAVREDRAELLDSAARPDVLRAMSERTGGRLFALERQQDLLEVLSGETAIRAGERRPEPAWDRAWIFVAIALTLGLEWIARRRRGLP